MTERLSIGDVAARSGVPATTLRYYEQLGLLPPPAREGGRRRYDPDALARLEVIGACKVAGFTLDEIQTLYADDEPGRPASRALGEAKLAEIDAQVATLEREYQLAQQEYAALTAKLRDAEISEQVERSRGGESFAILARAALPTAPAFPNIPRLMIITVLLGICAGGALALGREYLDRSIHDTRALNDLELPVLGEIPRISHV